MRTGRPRKGCRKIHEILYGIIVENSIQKDFLMDQPVSWIRDRAADGDPDACALILRIDAHDAEQSRLREKRPGTSLSAEERTGIPSTWTGME